MDKKDRADGAVKIGLPVPRELWHRFVDIADSMSPRVSKTALLEWVIRDFVEKTEKKGGAR